MATTATQPQTKWWHELRHERLFISPIVLQEKFSELPDLQWWKYQRLRDSFMRLQHQIERHRTSGRQDLPSPAVRDFVDRIFIDFLGHSRERWLTEQQVPGELKVRDPASLLIRPGRVLLSQDGQPRLLVMFDFGRRVGRGRGRNVYANLLTLLRETGVRLGLLTNGLQVRLVYANPETDAWVEWDAAEWFEAGDEGRDRLRGLMALLSPDALAPEDGSCRLLEAAEESRLRQADIAEHLQENVRRAVERLLECAGEAAQRDENYLEPLRTDPLTGKQLDEREVLAALYQAAVRVIMRLVILLFAEARELIVSRSAPAEAPAGPVPEESAGPADAFELYLHNYSLEGLWQWLNDQHRQGRTEEWPTRTWAWRRILALFRLIHDGCHLPQLKITAYGGELFRPGDPTSPDSVLRAIACLEDPRLQVTDEHIYEILRSLRTSEVRLPQGRYRGPVDFLRFESDYIGIIYEGLLDYQLRRAGELMVMLNLGQQPILPLAYLENLSDKELGKLLRELAKKDERGAEEAEAEEEELPEEVEPEAEESEPDEGDAEIEEQAGPAGPEDEEGARVMEWARRAVELLGWVKRPRGKKADMWRFEQDVSAAARRLVPEENIFRPGQFYLVRSLGIRKGTGTFYTRPPLTGPTVRRTLEPLVYTRDAEGRRTVRRPEEILSLKVCDPAMGSGSFLLAAVRYITDALYRAVEQHGCLDPDPNRGTTVLTIPAGASPAEALMREEIPAMPADERFRDMLLSRLRRHVVERCIYGVDINPVAVELARLALWIETMDPELPFEFLNHKLKVGNSLVGCWLDRVLDYPLLAWDREGGDGSRGPQTKRIKEVFKRAKEEMARVIEEGSGQMVLALDGEQIGAEDITEALAAARKRFAELHQAPLDRPEEAERLYREMRSDPAFAALKQACDRWCAVWFWPVDPEREIDEQPLLTPARFYRPDEEINAIVAGLAAQHKFFHWELEFPDVFTPERQGFDAVLANPPWETMKPISQEFFSEYDPVYRTRGKQEALRKQKDLFAQDPAIERRWLEYCAFYRAMSNWVKHAAEPFDASLARGRRGEGLKKAWAEARALRVIGLAPPGYPFQHQGSADLNSYKMFTELMWYLMRDGGRLGVILPSAIYSDFGSQDLRRVLLSSGRWEWLFVFENRRRIFPMETRYKFGPVIVQKGGRTQRLRAAFMRRDVLEWEERAEDIAAEITPEQIERFSPQSLSIMELKTRREVEICEKIYADHPLLGSEEWGVEFTREFDMTNDSHLFHRVDELEEQGYRPDGYGRWINHETEDIALPLYQSVMIWHFDPMYEWYEQGAGNRQVWRVAPPSAKVIRTQFLVATSAWPHQALRGVRLGFRRITCGTNERTMVPSLFPALPAGHNLPATQPLGDLHRAVALCADMGSLVYDFVLRRRMAGMTLNFFYMLPTPAPRIEGQPAAATLVAVSRLSFIHRTFARHWLDATAGTPGEKGLRAIPWQELWAVDLHERVQLRAFLDAVVAELYGLEWKDLEYIICGENGSFQTGPDESDPVGFWRVDKKHPWQFRHTSLTLVAFRELKEVGLEEFTRWSALPPQWAVRLADSEDIYIWRLPEEAEAYWRAQQDYEWHPREDWSHCDLHAHNILHPFAQMPVE